MRGIIISSFLYHTTTNKREEMYINVNNGNILHPATKKTEEGPFLDDKTRDSPPPPLAS